MKSKLIIGLLLLTMSCGQNKKTENTETMKTDTQTPFYWKSANVYFLLTDRFNNGNPDNDLVLERTEEPGKLRGFEGGDLKGVTKKINEGYFSDLGINALWMSPIVEQIHGGTDEGTGLTYGFHGYWAKDWTALDPNFGTKEDLKELVEAAHKKGIRVLLDAVINHTGPVTDVDPVWPDDWVRTGPVCNFDSYDNTVSCTLVENLPDILTESDENVELPSVLVEKWQKEGRYEKEMAELDAYFKRTGHPRAPRFYIMKWLADYITEYGIDGYRADTVKHTEEYVWQEFKKECDEAFNLYKQQNPEKVLDDTPFYLVGEVYNYGVSTGRLFDFGDRKVDYFDEAFESLINFEFKSDAHKSYEEVFSKYSSILENDLKEFGTLNYLSSHDDGSPFDAKREKPFRAANKLLLSPGTSQVYYGDESVRTLIVEGTEGDATLRSFMNWEDIATDAHTQKVLGHWQKLGKFRRDHPAVGAGKHQMITEAPYVFYRSFTDGDYKDLVVIGIDVPEGYKELSIGRVFADGDVLLDSFSGQEVTVKDGKVSFETPFGIVLLAKK
ncbi:MAG: alpha-amlyase [Bacteroidetes bacterium MedPE-SWsnd-G2]|nr:MAG: alpha-amlyase [Bacteroidetes bacterium MedPE-SWsnd-G2]